MFPYYSAVPFSDAIPVNVASDARIALEGLSVRERSVPRTVEPVQSVNISQASVNRFAREKLREALSVKMGYNRQGALGTEDTVGQLISEKA